MVGHAFRVDECPHNIHVVDGKHLMALHQLICDNLFGRHLDLQPELGRAHIPYSTGPPNPATTQIVCKFGEMHFWYDSGSICLVHH